MRPDTANWIATAEYDLETAHHLMATGRYLYVVFCCHIALEKMLKAHVTEVTLTVPDKTHDLVALIKTSGLQLSQPHLEFIGRINTASVVTRYPDDLKRAIGYYTEPRVQSYLRQTTEICEWLKQHPNLST